jgi:hypothetical protein
LIHPSSTHHQSCQPNIPHAPHLQPHPPLHPTSLIHWR